MVMSLSRPVGWLRFMEETVINGDDVELYVLFNLNCMCFSTLSQ